MLKFMLIEITKWFNKILHFSSQIQKSGLVKHLSWNLECFIWTQ